MNVFAKTAVILFIAFGLLMFGCTSTPQQRTEAGGQPTTTTTSQGTTGQVTANTSGPATNGSTSGGTGGSNLVDIAGQSIGELLSGGVAVKCTITVESNPPFDIYMKGNNFYRSETTIQTDAGNCRKMVTIKNMDKMYLGCTDGTLFAGSNCDWLEMSATDSNKTTITSTAASSMTPEDLAKMPRIVQRCEPWLFDESKFRVPAGQRSCTMDDMMRTMSAGAGG